MQFKQHASGAIFKSIIQPFLRESDGAKQKQKSFSQPFYKKMCKKKFRKNMHVRTQLEIKHALWSFLEIDCGVVFFLCLILNF